MIIFSVLLFYFRQHTQDYTLSRKQLFQDVLSYNLSLIGCSEGSTDEEIAAAAGFKDLLFPKWKLNLGNLNVLYSVVDIFK